MRNVFPEYKSEIVLGNGKFQLDPMSNDVCAHLLSSCQYYMAYLPKIQSEYKNFYSHYPAFTSFLVYTLH